jgi:hypothetical protein
MRLAGKHELHRPLAVVQQPQQPFGIVQKQVGPFVHGKAPREAKRQRVGIEHVAGGSDRLAGSS